MRVYRLMAAQWAERSVRDGRLKVSLFPDLNDPYELMAGALPDRPLRRRFAEWQKANLREHGVICFSKSWSNPVLWSHYGDKHAGICLRFEVPSKQLMAVSYHKGRVPLVSADLDGGKRSEALRQRLLYAKFQHWQYEDEVRQIVPLSNRVPEKGMYFLPFSDALRLTQVIVGPRSDVTRDAVEGWLGPLREGVTLTKARLAFKTFRVVTQRRGLR